MIYLDYAATTPMREEAINVFTECARNFYGNASSLHDTGTKAASLLQTCRSELANLLGGQSDGIYFTSGGSESNILAIRSLLKGSDNKGKHLITTKIEHSSVHNLFTQLESEGYKVTYLSVDDKGLIDLNELERAITSETILASIHHANSEIGTILPLQQIGELLHQNNVLFHTDCVQTFGKVPINVITQKIDSLSISSHKLYGPKGIGACYINPKQKWAPVFDGTSHEKGFRPGTVNVPGIASFLSAAQLIHENLTEEQNRLLSLRKKFLQGVKSRELPIHIEGHPIYCLPHIIGLTVNGIEGQYTMLECNRHGISISTGSACSIGKQAPSKTLIAIGKDTQTAKQFIRLSLGKWTTPSEIEQTLDTLELIISTFQNGQ